MTYRQELVEAAARAMDSVALANARKRGVPVERGMTERAEAAQVVAAVLAKLREPSEGMIEAARTAILSRRDEWHILLAMLDAVEAEG